MVITPRCEPGILEQVKEEGSVIPENNVAAPESLPADATPTPAIPAIATPTPAATGLSKELTELMNGIVRRLTEYQDEEYVTRLHPYLPPLRSRLIFTSQREISAAFQRMLNKRVLPDYFEIIKEPVAFSTVRVCAHRPVTTSYINLDHSTNS